MRRSLSLLTLLLFLGLQVSWAQQEAFDLLNDEDEEEDDEIVEGWNTSLSFGADLSQLFQLNPKQGAGQNRFGFGGAIFLDAIYKHNRILWENGASWQFGVQKLGAGIIVVPGLDDVKVPYQKTIDDLRLGSKLGYQLGSESPWYLAGAFTFQSLAAPSYPGPATYPGNFLKNIADTTLNAKFMSPGTITLSAGIEYAPNDHFSLFYSPIGAKWIIVADDLVASQGIHGNPVRGEKNEDGFYDDFDNTDAQLGSLLRARYSNKWADDRLSFRSNLTLYSNYLNNPQNIDVDWLNELAFELFAGFKINLLLTLFYDDDVRVQITDLNAPNGVKAGTGKRVSLTEQLLISYSIDF